MATNVKPAVILAEFDSVGALLQAAKKVREAGYRNFDCHSPFPIHGMDDAMGLKRSPLGFIVGVVAFLAISGVTYGLYWITAVNYPMVISGKPYFSFQAYTPVAFALTVLSSAFAALFGMLALNRLPRLHNPLFESERFAAVTDDKFFVSIDAQDPKFEPNEAKRFLESIGARQIEVISV